MPSDVGDYSERELIARIQACLPPPPSWMLVGIGDDAAVVEPEKNRVEVLSVDAIVDGVHFDRAFVPPDAIGHRALAVNLSDLAAMGAAPRLALLSLILPDTLPLADFDGIIGGLTALAAEHRVHVAGGNLTRSPGPLVIDVTITGTVKRRQALTRAGARAGDGIYVSGTIGAAAAGLRLLRNRPRPEHVVPPTADCGLIEAYLRPTPRVRLGVWLGRNRAASACVDLSDGMADGVHRIAEASGVGITIDADALPIDTVAREILRRQDGDPVLDAISSGDDYELLFAVRPRMRRHVLGASRHAGVSLTRIGVCADDPAVRLQGAGRDLPLPCGYTHFRRT